MRDEDVEAVVEVCEAALWGPLDDRGRPWARGRVEHLLSTDPRGAFVAEHENAVVGTAMALRREGLWGLSLLALDDGVRGRGLGRRLVDATLAYAEDARVRIVLSAEHPAAMRLYATSGFALRPCVSLAGVVTARPPRQDGVRHGDERDAGWIDAVARTVRGAGYGPDVAHWLDAGAQLRCVDERAWCLVRGGKLACLHALDEAAAVALLRDHLATATESVQIDFLTAGQDWAVHTGLEAGLALSPDGPLFVAGELGTAAPWIPSGAYL